MSDNLQDSTNWIYKLSTSGPSQASIMIKANPRWASTVTNRIEPYKSMPSKFKPALEAMADYMREKAIPRTFKDEGPGWPALAPRTQKERAQLGYGALHPILVRSGDLFQELTDKSHSHHVEIITTGPKARVILGGRSEKYIRNQLGNTFINIPPRSMIPGTGYVPLSEEDRRSLQEVFTEKIKEQMRNK